MIDSFNFKSETADYDYNCTIPPEECLEYTLLEGEEVQFNALLGLRKRPICKLGNCALKVKRNGEDGYEILQGECEFIVKSAFLDAGRRQ